MLPQRRRDLLDVVAPGDHPDHLLGRVTSAFWSTHYALGPIGAATLTWAAGRYGVQAVTLVAGAGACWWRSAGCSPRSAAPAGAGRRSAGLLPAPAGGTVGG
ncbi:hypothetical protein NKG94_11775 [Micromonospora sp. M12]